MWKWAAEATADEMRVLLFLSVLLSCCLQLQAVGECDSRGVFCMFVSKDGYRVSDGTTGRVHLFQQVFSLKIQRLKVEKKTDHKWDIFVDDSLSGHYITLNFMREETTSAADLFHVMIAHDDDGKLLVVMTNGLEAVPLTEELVTDLHSDANKLSFKTGSAVANTYTHMELDKVKVLVECRSTSGDVDGKSFNASTDFRELFFHPTAREKRPDSVPRPTASSFTKWLWPLLGVVSVIAVIVFIVLVYCGVQYVTLSRRTSSRRTPSFASESTKTITSNFKSKV